MGGNNRDNSRCANSLFELVGKPHVIIHIEKEVDGKTQMLVEKCGVLVDIGEGYYAVTPECLDKLGAESIPYSVGARYPIPKKTRTEIREALQNAGASGPV